MTEKQLANYEKKYKKAKDEFEQEYKNFAKSFGIELKDLAKMINKLKSPEEKINEEGRRLKDD